MGKNQSELNAWLNVLLQPQQAELPPVAWNQLRKALSQSSSEQLISQVTSDDKAAFSKALQATLSTYFENNQTIRNLDIQWQTILLLRAKTRNNHLASDYVRELESNLFREATQHSRQSPSKPKTYDYKQKEGKRSLLKCISSLLQPTVIKNLQFKAKSWTVDQLLKEYGEKEFLLTQKGNTFKNLQLREIQGNARYLANSGRFTDKIPRFLAHFAPISSWPPVVADRLIYPSISDLLSVAYKWLPGTRQTIPQRLIERAQPILSNWREEIDIHWSQLHDNDLSRTPALLRKNLNAKYVMEWVPYAKSFQYCSHQ